MSTPACIGVQYSEKIVCIYLSSSGYPAWAGAILLRHWNSLEKIEQLLQEGNLYHLDAELGEPHDRFLAQSLEAEDENPGNKGWCQFHWRDYDRRLLPPSDDRAQTFQYRETLLALNSAQATLWTYLFQDGKWVVYEGEARGFELTEEYIARRTSQEDSK